MRWIIPLAAIAIGIVRAVRSPGAPSSYEVAPEPGVELPTGDSELRDDPRVQAFLQAYGPLLDSVTFSEDDAVFAVGGRSIHFQDGRMLGEGRLGDWERFDPIFYRYSLEALREPPPLADEPTYSTDVLEDLFGRTETEIRRHCRSVTFLDHRMFVNTFSIEALQAVERDILQAARRDPAVASWIQELDVTYSFMNKDIAGSESRSYHSWGLAVDLVPTSYGGRQVYWRWSRVFNREGWHQIPLAQRWSPPQPVIQAFERHGFVWGGKWSRFDAIHFEYRPEVLFYNRIIAGGSSPP